MASDLPKEFDVVVLGTGMPESILAAAFSRVGHAVLHLDRNDYYSDDWASFNLQAVERWANSHKNEGEKLTEESLQRPDIDEASLLEEGETLVQLPLDHTNFSDIEIKFHVDEAKEETTPDSLAADVSGLAVQSADADVKPADDDTSDIPANTQGTSVTESTDQNIPEQPSVQIETFIPTLESKTDIDCVQDKQGKEAQSDGRAEDQSSSETGDKSSRTVVTDDRVVESSATVTESEEKADNVETENGDVGEAAVGQSGSEAGVQAVVAGQDQTDSCDGKNEEKPLPEKEKEKVWNATELKKEWRRFNLDLSPKVLYSGGRLVQLLISSDIAKYCEFKTVTQVLTILNGNLEKVPCSRADVFSSKKVSMLEKRMLMKFLTFCMEYETKTEDIQDFMDKPFVEFLKSRKLTANVQHFVQHSIAMATDSLSTKQGLAQTKKFLQSLGRYGNTAFLWSLYGSGELPQSFCRMCAVFGGLYCLRMTASSVIVDNNNRCKGIITTQGQRVACKWLIMNNGYAAKSFLPDCPTRTISRAIFLTEKPLLPSDTQELSLLCLPSSDDRDRPVKVLELPPGAMASVRGIYVFHLTRQGKDGVSPEEDLASVVDTLFQQGDEDTCKPRVLWSMYFSQKDTSQVSHGDNTPENIVLLPGPGTEVDIDRPVLEAEEIFRRLMPDEEFLPKAPNPEDIIHVDDADTQIADENKSDFTESPGTPSEPNQPTGQNVTDACTKESDQTDKHVPEQESATSNAQTEPAVTNSQPVRSEGLSSEEDSDTKTVDQSEAGDLAC